MLKNYRGKSGAPLLPGDSFTNDVRLTGKTKPIAGVLRLSRANDGEDNSEASQAHACPPSTPRPNPVNCATTTYHQDRP